MRCTDILPISKTAVRILAVFAVATLLPCMAAFLSNGHFEKPPYQTVSRQNLADLKRIRRKQELPSPATLPLPREKSDHEKQLVDVVTRKKGSAKRLISGRRKLHNLSLEPPSSPCPSYHSHIAFSSLASSSLSLSFPALTARSSTCLPSPISSLASSSLDSSSPSPTSPSSLSSPVPRSLSPSPSGSPPCSSCAFRSGLLVPPCSSMTRRSCAPPSPSSLSPPPLSQGNKDLRPLTVSQPRSISSPHDRSSDSPLAPSDMSASVPLRRLPSSTGEDYDIPVQALTYEPPKNFGMIIEANQTERSNGFIIDADFYGLRETKRATVPAQLTAKKTAALVNVLRTNLKERDLHRQEVGGQTLPINSESERKRGSEVPLSHYWGFHTTPLNAQKTPASFFRPAKGYLFLPQAFGKSPFVSVHSSDFRQAQYKQLEKWMGLSSTGIFNEVVWGCPGPSGYRNSSSRSSEYMPANPCTLLWEAEFCVSNYLLLESLISIRGYKRKNWIQRDGSDAGLQGMAKICEPDVLDWGKNVTVNCKRAMKNLNMKFPAEQCLKLNQILGESRSRLSGKSESRSFLLSGVSVFALFLSSLGATFFAL